ncbi:hypothetical protein [Consotaella aegiceratis]|uniref:hypothetical protein n=1 Tax=Consotaella aegiceratis TaxID=3097961 RepID=UPI002F3E5BDA
MIDAVTDGPVLPFDLRAVANEIEGVLNEYETAAAGRIDLTTLWQAWRGFRDGAEALAEGAEAAAKNPISALSYDRTLMAVTRLINPVLYQAGSEFAQDPATGTRLLPGLAGLLDLAPADSDALKMQTIGLRRQITRTADALVRATRHIQRT